MKVIIISTPLVITWSLVHETPANLSYSEVQEKVTENGTSEALELFLNFYHECLSLRDLEHPMENTGMKNGPAFPTTSSSCRLEPLHKAVRMLASDL